MSAILATDGRIDLAITCPQGHRLFKEVHLLHPGDVVECPWCNVGYEVDQVQEFDVKARRAVLKE